MESPVEDFDVLNVVPLFLGLTDLSLVSPIFVFILVLLLLLCVYLLFIGEPALSDNPQGFLVSWWQEYFNELTEEDYYLGFRIAPIMWVVGQIMICSVTILAVSNVLKHRLLY